MIGKEISHYKILEKLGGGGMGEVYKAFHMKLKRAVAIKRMRPDVASDPEHRTRFLREAQHAALISHDNVAEIHDVLEVGEELLLVMEYVEGRSLKDVKIEADDLAAFYSVAEQCLEGLIAAHGCGVIHRDLKPTNIMLTSSSKVKLLDFGLAQRTIEAADATTDSVLATERGRIPGTLAYMAPEVLRGEPADPRSDIFSLGIVFYELLTGIHPFLDATSAATAHRIMGCDPAPVSRVNGNVGPELERVIRKMLERDPLARYGSAEEAAADIRRARKYPRRFLSFLGNIPAGPWTRRIRWIAAAVILAALLVTLGPGLRESWLAHRQAQALTQNPTLAVMPLAGRSASSAFAAMAGGITEVLSHRLTRLSAHRSFSVVPLALARARGVTEAGEAGEQLGANLALSGEMWDRASDIRIELILLEEKTLRALRRTVFTAPLSDPITLDFLVAEKACELLGVRLEPSERRELADYGTADPVAYQRYLQGLGSLWYSDEPDHRKSSTGFFLEALQLDPGFARSRAALGMAHLTMYEEQSDPGSLQSALSHCSAAAETQADLAAAQLCLGRAYHLLGGQESALAHLERARYLDPSDTGILEELGRALESMGRMAEAEKVYKDAVGGKPEYWRPHSTLGTFYFYQARFEDAERELRRVTDLAPEYYRAHYSLCAVYGEMFRWPEMAQACQQSLEIREQGGAYTNLATAYFYQGRFAEAVDVARKAILFLDRNEKGGESYLDYGNLAEVLYWAPGERASAAAPYRKALEGAGDYLRLHPRDLNALGRMALYQAMLDDRESARRNLQLALEIGPDSAETLFKAAMISRQFGETDSAFAFLRASLEKGIQKAKVRFHPMFRDLRNDPRFRALTGFN